MAYSAPPNFVAGAVLTEAQLDTLSDDITFLANPPRCRVYNSANISLTTGVDTALTFNSERYDTDTMHSTAVNTSRITFTTAGTYDIKGHVSFAANATGQRTLLVRVDGATIIAVQKTDATAAGSVEVSVATEYAFTAGQYVELVASQNSGGALNVTAGGNYSPEFSARLVAVA